MRKREAAYTTRLQKWIVQNIRRSFPLEVKMAQPRKTTGPRLCLSQFKRHQIPALVAATNPDKPFVYKIPDGSISALPFDVIVYCGAEAFVVAVFDERRFYMIDARVAKRLFEASPCIGEEEARAAATHAGEA